MTEIAAPIEFLSDFPKESYPPFLVEQSERRHGECHDIDAVHVETCRPGTMNSIFYRLSIRLPGTGKHEQKVRQSPFGSARL